MTIFSVALPDSDIINLEQTQHQIWLAVRQIDLSNTYSALINYAQ
jgi:hypothetical protein